MCHQNDFQQPLKRQRTGPTTGEFLAILAANGHKYVIEKIFKFPHAIGGPAKYLKYNTQNNLIFSGIELGLVISIICGRVDNNSNNNGGRPSYINIYALHIGKGSDENCDKNSWDKISSLKITRQYPGGWKPPPTNEMNPQRA